MNIAKISVLRVAENAKLALLQFSLAPSCTYLQAVYVNIVLLCDRYYSTCVFSFER